MSVEMARKILSRMPDSVFQMWIEPIVARIGWPFLAASDSTFGTEWERMFDHLGMEVIAQLRWELEKVPARRDLFDPTSVAVIKGLIEAHVCHQSNVFALAWSKLRYDQFVYQHAKSGSRRILAPCVLMLDRGLYRILDGNHRIAALYVVCNGGEFEIDAWVGRMD